MVRWIFGIFIILDCIYQLFAQSKSVVWAAYYDIMHYSTLLSFAVYFLINSFNKIYYVFTSYFVVVLGLFLYDYFFNYSELKGNNVNPVYFSSVLILLILTIFITWMKLKKAGKL